MYPESFSTAASQYFVAKDVALFETRVGLASAARRGKGLALPSGMGSESAEGNFEGSTTLTRWQLWLLDRANNLRESIEKSAMIKAVREQRKAKNVAEAASPTSSGSFGCLPPGAFFSPVKSHGSFSSPDNIVLPPFGVLLGGEEENVAPLQGAASEIEHSEDEVFVLPLPPAPPQAELNQFIFVYQDTPPPQTPMRIPPAHKISPNARGAFRKIESKRNLSFSPSKTASAKPPPPKAVITKAPRKAPLGPKAGRSRGRMQVQKAIEQCSQLKIVDYFQPVRR